MAGTDKTSSRRVIVIGGSLGGLFAGTMLRHAGWQVDIDERSTHDLDSRGGGIVLQPDVIEVFRRIGIEVDAIDLGVRSRFRTVFEADGTIKSKELAPQTQTSWSLIYTTMKQAFGDGHYHQGKTLVDLRQNRAARTVTAVFEDGSARRPQ